MTQKLPGMQVVKKPKENDDFRELLDSIMLPVVVTELESSEVLYLNNAALQYFKISQTQLAGISSTFFWEDPDQGTAYVRKVKKEKQIKQYKAVMKNRDGDSRQVLVSGHLTLFHGKNAISSVFEDITKESNENQALKESEEKYHYLYNMMRLLADTVPDLIWVKDLNDNFLFSNKANNEKMLKCDSASNPIGRNHAYYVNRERNKGKQYTFGEVCANSDRIVKTTQKAGNFLEDGLVRGEYLKLDVYKAPLFSADGTIVGTVGAGRDITQEAKMLAEKLANEKRYRLLAENVEDVVWTVDTDLKITYVSPSLKTTLGYAPERFINTKFTDYSLIFGEEFVSKFISHIEKLKNHERPDAYRQVWELEVKRREGTKIWVEIVLSKLTDSDGKFLGLIGVARDVTNRVTRRKELKKVSEHALAANQAKSEFLANMSHEIRTPINGVLGMLQLLKDTSLDLQQEKYVDTGLQSGTSLLRLISDILDFSKIEAGKIELTPVYFELRSFLNNVISTFKTMRTSSLVKLNLQVEEKIPTHVVADKYRLQQVLYNLLGNAVKFTNKGRIQVKVGSSVIRNGKVLLRFTVKDTGIGMSQDNLRNIFDPFVQVDGSFQRKYAGAGLGLSIVKQLVTLMRGDVQIQSCEGEGTKVDFTIFATIPRDSEIEQPTDKKLQIDQNDSLAVLVVEDEKINAMVITAMLEKMGHRVTLAIDGREAIDIVRNNIFDCILMDIQMPDMDGLETTRIIREEDLLVEKNTPIIAVTAHAMWGDRENFLTAGMDDYITKPVNAATLQETINRVLT